MDQIFLSDFVFRGQADSNWNLSTSLERFIGKMNEIDSKQEFVSPIQSKAFHYEKCMLDEFEWKYDIYKDNVNKLDEIQKLTIMQHYGCPTRLLDFTNSLWIAAFMALNEFPITEAVVWCINSSHLYSNLIKALGEDLESLSVTDSRMRAYSQFIKCIQEPNCPDNIFRVMPKKINERLHKQQGLFLMPSNLNSSFEKILNTALNLTGEYNKIKFSELIQRSKVTIDSIFDISETKIIKIRLPLHTHYNILNCLRLMTVTAENLFPGLEGMCKSLAFKYSHPIPKK